MIDLSKNLSVNIDRMVWPTIDEIRKLSSLPMDYELDLLRYEEVDTAIEFFNTWFPSISVGIGSSFLSRTFYEKRVVYHNRPNAEVLALVVRHKEEIVAIATWEKIDKAEVISGRVGAVSKSHRQLKLAVMAQELGEKIGRLMGAGLICGLATSRNPHMQQALERAGYTATGILPGFDLEEVEPGKIRRVYEIIYVKQIAPTTDFLIPTEENLTPAVARLYVEIFKSNPVNDKHG